MFYLLENGKIIDSDNFPYEWKFYTVLISEKDKTIILHCPDPRDRKKYQIKKQSENVYDLIEEGDLVKTKLLEDFNLLEIVTNEGVFERKHITIIYKPDEKGNYIKVWEVKGK